MNLFFSNDKELVLEKYQIYLFEILQILHLNYFYINFISRRHNPGEKRREDEQTQGGKQQNKDKKKTRQEKHEDRKYIESLTDSTVRIGEEGETKKPKKREFQFFSRVTATTCWVQPIQYNWAGPSLKKREQWRPGRPQVQLDQFVLGQGQNTLCLISFVSPARLLRILENFKKHYRSFFNLFVGSSLFFL